MSEESGARSPAGERCRDVPGRRPVVEHRRAFDGLVWDVVTERVDLGNGTVVTRDFVQHPGAVAIMAYRESGEVLLLRQYRHPVGRELWEPPAGLLDEPGEDPLDAAKRELREEADLSAATWHVLADFFTSPGGSSEAIRVYLARGLREVPEGDRFARIEEERDMVVGWVRLEDALVALQRGHIASPTATVGLLALESARQANWVGLRLADSPWERP